MGRRSADGGAVALKERALADRALKERALTDRALGERVRTVLGDRMRAMVGSTELDLSRPEGDDGLFGPDSATWAVHGDFPSMLIGGTASLLMQMLHPGALAGVWDHSDFRRGMAGRLKRTAQFVTVTTYGSTAAANASIARVRGIHRHVVGTLPDGRPYAAGDPALLTWVHAAEVECFLRAHLAYRDPAMPMARQDAYISEMAQIAQALGAENVPTSRAMLSAYLEGMRPALRVDHRTRDVARRLLDQPVGGMIGGPANTLMLKAAIDLLPRWAKRLHGWDAPAQARAGAGIRVGAAGIGHVLRWALKPTS